MSKVVDIGKVQRALDRAARNAKRGSSEMRAGKVLLGRDAASGQFVAKRARTSARPAQEKK
jgi:hypothetical protein